MNGFDVFNLVSVALSKRDKGVSIDNNVSCRRRRLTVRAVIEGVVWTTSKSTSLCYTVVALCLPGLDA